MHSRSLMGPNEPCPQVSGPSLFLLLLCSCVPIVLLSPIPLSFTFERQQYPAGKDRDHLLISFPEVAGTLSSMYNK